MVRWGGSSHYRGRWQSSDGAGREPGLLTHRPAASAPMVAPRRYRRMDRSPGLIARSIGTGTELMHDRCRSTQIRYGTPSTHRRAATWPHGQWAVDPPWRLHSGPWPCSSSSKTNPWPRMTQWHANGRRSSQPERRRFEAALQRLEPFADGGRTHGKRQVADIEPSSQCRREGQQCAEQLTTALLLRDRGQ